ncbi:MAG: hypothetical protein R3231_05010 [bacterium]|nr:hypothetical protein [bacterium]
MAKKIAVVVRDRQGEALRMAVGTILLDDTIDVFVLDRQVEETGENTLYVETIQDLEMNAYSNVSENSGMQFMTTAEMAEKFLEYDHVLPY